MSKSMVETITVTKTPKISITTCIVVELCAGSTSQTYCKNKGNIVPNVTLVNTIQNNDVVMAIVSCMGVANNIALINPAMDSKMDSITANCISFFRKDWSWCLDFMFNVPNAKDRIT